MYVYMYIIYVCIYISRCMVYTYIYACPACVSAGGTGGSTDDMEAILEQLRRLVTSGVRSMVALPVDDGVWCAVVLYAFVWLVYPRLPPIRTPHPIYIHPCSSIHPTQRIYLPMLNPLPSPPPPHSEPDAAPGVTEPADNAVW